MSKKEVTTIDTIVRGGRKEPKFYLPTPSAKVNEHLRYGGIPSGSFMQVVGKNESTFKSTITLQMLAEAQKMGLEVGYIDAEFAMDFDWAEDIGVDTDRWFFSTPTTGEIAWETCYKMIQENGCKVVILDSMDSMLPSVTADNEVGDATIGTAAKMHTQGIRKALSIMEKNDAIIIGINHKKVNITRMGAMGHTTGGGKAIGFYSKLILELSSGSPNSKANKEYIDLNIFIEKNKLGKSYIPIKEVVQQGVGIVPEYSVLTELLSNGTIKKSGGWYKYEGETIGQGLEGALEWIRNEFLSF